jgi:flagellar basal body rod protein FlgG
MIEGITSAARSLEKSSKNISVIANNLANLDTVGYKKDASFYQILGDYQQPEMHEYTDFVQGEILPTSNPLNFALKGDVFFVLEKDGENLYTRNGKFSIDEEGFLVNEEGLKVLGQRGEINIKENMLDDNQTVTITKDGEIKIGNVELDNLLIAKIEDKNKLKKISSSNFVLEDDTHTVADESEYEVSQGFLESSNVSAIDEMQEMIKTSKNYESAQKIVTYFDTSLEKANEIGKV